MFSETEIKSAVRSYLNQRESNKRWRERNSGQVREYHKKYNEKRKQILNLIRTEQPELLKM